MEGATLLSGLRRAWGMVLLALVATPGAAVADPAADLPPALRSLPFSALVQAFSTSFERPELAAEVARHRAWAPPVSDEEVARALAQVMRDYPGTSDARRSLLDLAGLYAKKGEWRQAEAPFRFVMEVAKGQREGRMAHVRLLELYRYAGAPPGVDPLVEWRKAAVAYVGTPEEGLARMYLADVLVEKGHSQEALPEFEAVLARFPQQPYSSYARIRYALALMGKAKHEEACAALAPVIESDPVWGGRARWARAKSYRAQGRVEEAVADYEKAGETADSVWMRGDCYAELTRLYTSTGDAAKALASAQRCLALSPSRPDKLDILIGIVQRLVELDRYLDAAETAVGVELEVTNSRWQYSPADAARVMAELDPVIKKCEDRLSGKKATNDAGTG